MGRRFPNQFRVPVARPKAPGPETIPSYWHPNRAGVRKAPASFMQRIEELGWNELDVTWNPIRERWQVFARAPKMNHPIIQGWKLLFIHQGPSGEYLPLDERVLARLYHASAMAHGNGRQYFERLVSEMERDRERAEAQSKQDSVDAMTEAGYDFWKIKVSMAGKSSGSKFSEYHA